MEYPIGLEQFDEVLITGRSSAPVHDFEDLRCVVATISHSVDEGDYIKVWPCPGEPDPDGGGKVWFPMTQVTAMVVVGSTIANPKAGGEST